MNILLEQKKKQLLKKYGHPRQRNAYFAERKNGSLSIRKKIIYTNDSYVETKEDLYVEISGIKYKIANNQLEPYKTNVLKEYWQKLIPLNYKYRGYPQITDLSSCSKEDKNKGFDLSTLVNEALKKIKI